MDEKQALNSMDTAVLIHVIGSIAVHHVDTAAQVAGVKSFLC